MFYYYYYFFYSDRSPRNWLLVTGWPRGERMMARRKQRMYLFQEVREIPYRSLKARITADGRRSGRGSAHRLNMEVGLQSLFGLHVT
jgi:hypothetical protein